MVPNGQFHVTLLDDDLQLLLPSLEKCTKKLDILLSNPYLCTRDDMADLTADKWVREMKFSTEPMGCQWAFGSCTTMMNVIPKMMHGTFRGSKVNDSHTLQVPLSYVATRQSLILAGPSNCVLLQSCMAKFNEILAPAAAHAN